MARISAVPIGQNLFEDYDPTGGYKGGNKGGVTQPAPTIAPPIIQKQSEPEKAPWTADFTLPGIKFGNYLADVNKLSSELKQNEATTGQQTAPALKSAIMEEGLKIGAEQASQDVLSRKEDIIKGKQQQVAERAIQLQEEQLEEMKDQDEGGGGTVICSELNRQGKLPDSVLMLDSFYSGMYISQTAYAGYRAWADKIVWLMAHSKLVTWIIEPFVKAFAYEAASRVMPDTYKGSLLGKVIISIGVPICEAIGSFSGRYKCQDIRMG